MHRRHVLQQLLKGLAAGSLLGPALLPAQNQPTGQAGVARTGGAQPGQKTLSSVIRSQAEYKIDPAAWKALQQWEHYTKGVERLNGAFDRYVYDGTFLVEKRASGEFWYESPDKGRIDFRPTSEKLLPEPNASGQRLNPRKQGPQGQPYTVQADNASRWVCRGDALLYIDDEQKTYEVMRIPPHMQGQNITRSPLPFLFGMSAEEMDRRYYITLGQRTEYAGRKVVNLIAAPRTEALAKEWSRAEVFLDPGTYFQDSNRQPVFVPVAMRLFDSTGNTETVYFFRLDQTKLNAGWLGGFRNPFTEPNGILQGYTCTGTHDVAMEPKEENRTVENPQQVTPGGLFR
ncbi:MAG: hypothetical protein KDA75_10180 [Planctomycetaceae bacterium]|nr:hypothetical protein [Planctomycetaceae bacterium]